MFELKKYEHKDKFIWDKFVESSRVKSFLFFRDFMDYHSDRFDDFSMLIYRKNKLIALLPGNISSNV
jgi:hypothetical protein